MTQFIPIFQAQGKNFRMAKSKPKTRFSGEEDEELFDASEKAGKLADNTGKSSISNTEHGDIEAQTANILIIYTGGTIGMKKGMKGFVPVSNYLYQKLLSLPQFHDSSQPPLTTPVSRFGKRIHYEILEYEKLLDSSNMNMSDWVRIAHDIHKYYEQYDGFIILHGTDTMAYTASALSFMLENLAKTVIITGSQIPISVEPNDAVDNLSGALNIAGHYEIPEVLLFFNNKLYRGNRCIKDDATGLDAFKSPNFAPLVRMGINIKVSWENILTPPVNQNLIVHSSFDPNVGVLKLFPSITEQTIRNFLLPPLKGCVLETYGTGNAPDNRKDFLAALKDATDRGVVVVNVTQCSKGMVECNYATGRALVECGVISGYDLTTECALAKLAFLFGKGLNPEEVKDAMQKNLRGEITIVDTKNTIYSFKDSKFSQSVAALMTLNRQQDTTKTEKALLPVLLCTAASTGDIEQIKFLLKSGAEINCSDYDLRTPLHLAVANGQLVTVQFLLQNGARANATDRWGATPLVDAIRTGNSEAVNLLLANGSNLFELKSLVNNMNSNQIKETVDKIKAQPDWSSTPMQPPRMQKDPETVTLPQLPFHSRSTSQISKSNKRG